MNSLPSSSLAEQPEGNHEFLVDDPQFGALFQGNQNAAYFQRKGLNAYLPSQIETPGFGLQPMKFLTIQPILLPSSAGSSRRGKTDTSGGPAYILDAAKPLWKKAGAKVLPEIVSPVERLMSENMTPPDARVKNCKYIVKSVRQGMENVFNAIQKGALPVVLGGDHTSSMVAVGGGLMAYPRDAQDPTYSTLKNVHKDGHPDALGQPLQTGNAHGRTQSTLWGIGPDELMPIMEGIALLNPKNSLFIGVHHPDAPEAQLLHSLKCPVLDQDTLMKHPGLAAEFIAEFVKGHHYNSTSDPDVLSKLVLMKKFGKRFGFGEVYKPGAPMATLEGMQTNTYFSICRTLGNAQRPAVIEAAEVSPYWDRKQGGLTRDHIVGGIMREMGCSDPEYTLDYDPFAA